MSRVLSCFLITYLPIPSTQSDKRFEMFLLTLLAGLLRAVEAYDRTLVITSRSTGGLSKGFESRIQVALLYPFPDPANRRRIWQSFFDVLRSDDEPVDLDGIAARMDDLARHEMNGRQIRNAVMTARRLAASEGAAVAWAHLERALSVASEMTRPTSKIPKVSQLQRGNVLTDFDFESFLSSDNS